MPHFIPCEGRRTGAFVVPFGRALMDPGQWAERGRQWRRFHEWEKTLTSTGSLESRVKWFAEAWEIAQRFQGSRSAMLSEEKIERVRKARNVFAKIKVA